MWQIGHTVPVRANAPNGRLMKKWFSQHIQEEISNRRVDLVNLLSEATELSIWAGSPELLEESQILQTRWEHLLNGCVTRRKNLEVEKQVCTKNIHMYSFRTNVSKLTSFIWFDSVNAGWISSQLLMQFHDGITKLHIWSWFFKSIVSLQKKKVVLFHFHILLFSAIVFPNVGLTKNS